MKPRPQPKRELIIVQTTSGIGGGGVINLRCVSEDARDWVRSEAPGFGRLFDASAVWLLIVNAEYDLQEVVEFLDSYNDEDEAQP